MNQAYYLRMFEDAASQLDTKVLRKKKLEVATGLVLESVFLKLYKSSWANPTPDPLTAPSRIFFSIWINDRSIQQNKLMYNIHALKLRQLKDYQISSKVFAAAFRDEFKKVEKKWPNVRTQFGPLTLMEGWMTLHETNLQGDVQTLATKFLEIDYLVDGLLEKYRK